MDNQSPPPDAGPPLGGRSDLAFVRLPYLITGTLFLAAIAINFANVIGRFVFFAPIFWAEEVLVFLIIWSVFLAAASIVYRGEHINMDLFYSGMAWPLKRVVNVAILVLLIAGCALVSYQSWKVLSLMRATQVTSVAAGIPMVIPHAAIAVGFGLMILAAVVRWRAYLSGSFDRGS